MKISLVLFILLFRFIQCFPQNNQQDTILISSDKLNRAFDLNNEGYSLLLTGEYAKSISYFDSAISIYPNNCLFFQNRAFSRKQINDTLGALNDYLIAYELDPGDPDINYMTGITYKELNQTEQAIEFLSNAVLLCEGIPDNPNMHLYYFNRGILFINIERYDLAVLDFNESIDLNLHHIPSYHNRGIALFKSKRKDDACWDWYIASAGGIELAKEYLKKYCPDVTVDKNIVDSIVNLPQFNYFEDTSDKANPVLFSATDQTAISTEHLILPSFIGGEHALLDFTRTNILYPVEAREKGIEGTLQMSFVIYPDGSIGEIEVLNTHKLGNGIEEEAIRVLKLMDQMWMPGQKDGEKVSVRFTMPIKFSLNEDKKDYIAYYNEGVDLMNKQDYEKAIKSFSTSIQMNSSIPNAFFARGFCKYQLNDLRGAIYDWESAKEKGYKNIDKNLTEAYFLLGNEYLDKKSFPIAIMFYTKAIDYTPNEINILYNRGIAYLYIGDIEMACIDWQKIHEMGCSDAHDLLKKYCENK